MQVIAAYDNDAKAVATYNANWHPVAQVADLKNWRQLDIPDCDGIIAGPPCQDASRLKSSGYADQGRSWLYVETAKLIAEKNPAWALMENVPDMGKTDEFVLANRILWDAGYWVTVVKLCHAAFGGLSTRERLFLVAARRMLAVPSPVYQPRDYKPHGKAIAPMLESREPDGWGGTDVKRVRAADVDGNVTFNTQQYWSWRTWRHFDEPYATLTKSNNGHTKSRYNGEIYKWGTTERAVIQGFPTSFTNLTNSQIGNSVPPELARAWGSVIRSAYGSNQNIVSLFCGAGGFDFIQEAA